ncbi:response regulator transcription factor [Erwinia phyllosphaerae]|uniref:response regulator transcription factor n=1 Tax=Erwinia phyllosphaerae TaxID=2853256 RepID=UPI001FEEF5BB|nr:helix-turn-helix transcriptional regulator [Erwinia phyllosphaerae]MBV4367129.1 helix-turn-helix transcriptional regulator [Erwinia phyllosphaerae]
MLKWNASISADSLLLLTKKEQEILELIKKGLSNKLIARQLGITPDTVVRHSSRINQKIAAQPLDGNITSILLEKINMFIKNNEIKITPTELSIWLMTAQGLSAKQIARHTSRSPRTIEKQRESIMEKCNVNSFRKLMALIICQ